DEEKVHQAQVDQQAHGAYTCKDRAHAVSRTHAWPWPRGAEQHSRRRHAVCACPAHALRPHLHWPLHTNATISTTATPSGATASQRPSPPPPRHADAAHPDSRPAACGRRPAPSGRRLHSSKRTSAWLPTHAARAEPAGASPRGEESQDRQTQDLLPP